MEQINQRIKIFKKHLQESKSDEIDNIIDNFCNELKQISLDKTIPKSTLKYQNNPKYKEEQKQRAKNKYHQMTDAEKEEIKRKKKERYHNDPVYRQKQLEKSLEYARKRKILLNSIKNN